jgi:hypothetical protein
MKTRVKSPAGPFVAISDERLALAVSQWCDAKGIATDAQFSAAINGLTDAQFMGLLKAVIKNLVEVGGGAAAP